VLALSYFISAGSAHAGSVTQNEAKPEDALMVKGRILHGWINRLGPKGVKFITIYGEGELFISYEDMDNVVSQRTFLIFCGENQPFVGKLIGIEDGQLLVGADKLSGQRIPLQNIEIGLSEESYKTSRWNRVRAKYRYWRGSFDLGYSHEQGAVDKDKFEASFRLRHRKRPTRFVFDVRYAYEIQQKKDNPELTTKDELATFAMGEFDIRDRFFLFGRPAFEYDKPRNVEHRWFPAAGIGYRVLEGKTKETFLDIPVGIGFVGEDFGGIGTNSYVSWYLGLQAGYDFGRGIVLSGFFLYMPRMGDPDEDWLYRSELELTVPVFDPLAIKVRLTDVNDDNPTPQVGNNKFTGSLLLSIRFDPARIASAR
jgi:hypothetical protein